MIRSLGGLRQEDCRFQTSLGYITRPCLKKINKGLGCSSMPAYLSERHEAQPPVGLIGGWGSYLPHFEPPSVLTLSKSELSSS